MGLIGHTVASQGQSISVPLWRLPLFSTRQVVQLFRAGDRGTQVICSVLYAYSSPTYLHGLIFTQNYRFAPKIFAFEQYWIVQRLVLKGIASLFSICPVTFPVAHTVRIGHDFSLYGFATFTYSQGVLL